MSVSSISFPLVMSTQEGNLVVTLPGTERRDTLVKGNHQSV